MRKPTNDHTTLLWGLLSEAQYEADVVLGNGPAMVDMITEAPRDFNNGLNGTPFDTSTLTATPQITAHRLRVGIPSWT